MYLPNPLIAEDEPIEITLIKLFFFKFSKALLIARAEKLILKFLLFFIIKFF